MNLKLRSVSEVFVFNDSAKAFVPSTLRLLFISESLLLESVEKALIDCSKGRALWLKYSPLVLLKLLLLLRNQSCYMQWFIWKMEKANNRVMHPRLSFMRVVFAFTESAIDMIPSSSMLFSKRNGCKEDRINSEMLYSRDTSQ